jgi:hypothetical protein
MVPVYAARRTAWLAGWEKAPKRNGTFYYKTKPGEKMKEEVFNATIPDSLD